MDSVKDAEQCKAQLDKAPLIIISFCVCMGKLELMQCSVLQLMCSRTTCGAEVGAGAHSTSEGFKPQGFGLMGCSSPSYKENSSTTQKQECCEILLSKAGIQETKNEVRY